MSNPLAEQQQHRMKYLLSLDTLLLIAGRACHAAALASFIWLGAAVHTVLTQPATVYTLTIPSR